MSIMVMKKPDLSEYEWKYIDDILAEYSDGYSTPATIVNQAVVETIDQYTSDGYYGGWPGWLMRNAATAYEGVTYRLGNIKALGLSNRFFGTGGNLMRPIIFRAWDKAKKQMFEDVQDEYATDDFPEWSETGAFSFGYLLDDKDFVVEQSTGVNDKNDKGIYEGDIVRWKDEFYAKSNLVGKVAFRNGAFIITGTDRSKHTASDGLTIELVHDSVNLVDTDPDDLEILGNIHENPELLEGN